MYESGGRQSLQIAFNVLNDGCGGCHYESYPYKAQVPIKINGKYQTWEFKSKEDVWKAIDILIKDTIKSNEISGNNFDIIDSVAAQISFFACKNIFLDRKIQKDIERYLYCDKFSVPPYKGDYGEQPYLWTEKAFLIKKYFAKLESKQINKAKEDGSRKN